MSSNPFSIKLPETSKEVQGQNGVNPAQSTPETRDAAEIKGLKSTDIYSYANGNQGEQGNFQNYDGFSAGGANETSEEKNAEESINEAESGTDSSRSWKSKCQGFTTEAKESMQKMLGFNKKMKTQEQDTVKTVEKNNNEKDKLEEENTTAQSEIDALTAEKESLLAEQGTGQQPQAQPAMAMAMPMNANAPAPQGGEQGGQQGEGAMPQGASMNAFASSMPQSGGNNEGRLAEIDSEIGSKAGTMTSNSSGINSLSMNNKFKTTSFNNFLNNVKTQTGNIKKKSTSNGSGAKVAQTVGSATTMAGTTCTALGTAAQAGGVFSFGISSAIGAKLLAVGIPATAAGGATTVGASAAQGNVQDALAGATNTIGQYGSSVKTLKGLEKS